MYEHFQSTLNELEERPTFCEHKTRIERYEDTARAILQQLCGAYLGDHKEYAKLVEVCTYDSV